jgi:O-acetyl-ADP-ribose deacetylase (regulator of RNase III)
MEPWIWSMGLVSFAVRVGDLLAAPESAIVNPENSGFLLSRDGRSISGQVSRRYPETQALLDAQTGRRCLPEGSVLLTRHAGGRVIFHAGHHHPGNWLQWRDDVTEDDVAVHLSIIARCIADILDQAEALALDAVAFPLIGSGAFGLPLASTAQVLFQGVADFARRATRKIRVALVLLDASHLEAVVRSGTRVLASMIGGGAPLLQPAGGHAVLAQLRPGVRSGVDPILQQQGLLRFVEVGLHIDLMLLLEHRARGVHYLLKSVDPRRGGFHFTFGFIANCLEMELREKPVGLPAWLADRVELLARRSSLNAIHRLKEDRNNLAHLRAARDVEPLIDDVEQVFGPAALPQNWGPVSGKHWIASMGKEVAVADGLDVATSRVFWLLPVSRGRISTPLALEQVA